MPRPSSPSPESSSLMMLSAYSSHPGFGATSGVEPCRPYSRSPTASSSRKQPKNYSKRLGSPAQISSPSPTPTRIRVKTERASLDLQVHTAVDMKSVDVKVPLQDRNQPSSTHMLLSSPEVEIIDLPVSPPSSPRKRAASPKANNASKKQAARPRSAARSASPLSASKAKVNLKIPQRLPKPTPEIVSNPYDDLPSHLRRHGLFAEADEIEAVDMPLEYLLGGYITMGQLGKSRLYDQTADFIPRLKFQLQSQISVPGGLPPRFRLDVSLDSCGSSLPPTHILAVHDSKKKVSLLAAHAMVLALQCSSIPFLQACSEGDLPVVPLVVPHPEQFHITHRWLYSQETGSLFQDLIPMTFVVRYLSTTGKKDTAQDVAEALSHLGTTQLLDCLSRIQAVWKNGAAIGILSSRYWEQLDKAWEYVLAALVLAKKRKSAAIPIEQATAELEGTSL